MTSEYVEYKIGEIATIVGGGTPDTSDKSLFDGDIPWITPKDMSDNPSMYTSSGYRNLSADGLSSCSAKMIPAGSILMSSRAPVGLLTISANPVCTNQGIRSLILNEDIADAEYVYYKLRTMLPMLEAYSSGATFPEISGSSFGKISIILPSLEQQKSISRKLRAIDSMIETLGTQSSLLGLQVSAIFRSWFIDFNPMKAKAGGKLSYGMDEETAALFPDSFEDSELGPIPTGWRIGTISEFGRIVTGRTPSSNNPEHFDGPIPFITIPDLDRNIWQDETERTISQLGADALKSALIPVNSVCVSCIATVGNVGITSRSSITNQQIHSIICDKGYSSQFVYSVMVSFVPNLKFFAGGGAVVQNISKSMFGNQKILIPPIEIAESFTKMTGHLYEKIRYANTNSRCVEEIRDVMLPRLMSGELQVPTEA